MCSSSNIYIERSIGLTNKGKQFEINHKSPIANLITSEAIFLLSKKTYNPVKIKSKQKILSSSTVIANPLIFPRISVNHRRINLTSLSLAS